MYIVVVAAHYLVILYCCKKIRWKIKNASSKSRRSQAEQTAQLMKIFTAQVSFTYITNKRILDDSARGHSGLYSTKMLVSGQTPSHA